eukprot:s1278_g5.t1
MAGDMATSLLGATASSQRSQALRAGFAVALVGSGVLMGIAMERAGGTAAVALTSQEPLPAGIAEGLEGYTQLFSNMDASVLPRVFHKQMSMSALENENNLSSFQVMDYSGLEDMLQMFTDVFAGRKPESSLPKDLRGLKGATMIGATTPVTHYRLGPNEYVTEIYDTLARDGKVLVAFHTNLHWIKTTDGWRIKDKIYATLP